MNSLVAGVLWNLRVFIQTHGSLWIWVAGQHASRMAGSLASKMALLTADRSLDFSLYSSAFVAVKTVSSMPGRPQTLDLSTSSSQALEL